MALVNSIDPDVAAKALSTWLRDRLPDGADPQVTGVRVPKESGLSMETLMVDAEWCLNGQPQVHRLVVRVAPTGPGLYMEYDIAREAAVMRAVHQAGTSPIPKMLWSEDDPEVLGSPFLVMEFLDGRIPRDDPPFTAEGWVLDLTPEERTRMYDSGLAAMAGVHRTPVDGLVDLFDRSDLGSGVVEQHLGRVEELFAWATGGAPNSIIEAGLAWLRANEPEAPSETCLCWGDGRLGNLSYDADLNVNAVLDWEASTIAVPEYDLGWWRFAMRHHSEGMGLPMPTGFPSGDEVVARYEAISGRTAEHLEFWEVLNAVRFCCLVARGASLMIAGGLLPPESPMAVNNPATRILADLLGIEVPSGEVEYYVGNR